MIAKIKKHLFVHSSNKIMERNGRIALFILLGLIFFGLIRNLGIFYLNNHTDFMVSPTLFSVVTQLIVATLIFSIYLYIVNLANQFADDSEAQAIQLKQTTNQLQKVAEVTGLGNFGRDIDDMLDNAVKNIREQFGYCYIALFLLDESEGNLLLKTFSQDEFYTPPARPAQLPLQQDDLISKTAVNQKSFLTANGTEVSSVDPNHSGTLQIEATFPLIVRNKHLGVLDIQSNNKNAFKPEDIAVLQILANQIAISIDNAQLFLETEARLHETNTLYEFNLTLSSTADLGEIYRRTAREFATHFHGYRCVIHSLEPNHQDELITEADFWHKKDGKILNEFQIEDPIISLKDAQQLRTVLYKQKPLVDLIGPSGAADREECLRVPLVHSGNTMGSICVFRESVQPALQPSDIQRAQTMANQTAVSLANTFLSTETQGRVAQLSTLYRMSLVLSEADTLKEVFDGARREILSLIAASGMNITLVTPDKKHLHWIYAYEYGEEHDMTKIPLLTIDQGFSGYVYRTREVLHLTPDEKDIERFNSFIVGADLNSWLGLPMVVAGEIIGVLSIESDDVFSTRDVELLKTVVGPISIAINNLMQFEEVEKALAIQSEQSLHLQTAAEVAATAATVLEQKQLIDQAVELIKDRFQLYYVGIFLVDEKEEYAVLQAGSGEAGEIQIANNHKLLVGGQSLIGGATGDGVPRIIQDVAQDEEWRPNPVLLETKSELALPLQVRNKIIGALTVQSTTPNLFTPELVRTLHTMSDQLAIAIENAQLLHQAQNRAKREQKINQVSAQLHQSSDVDEIISVGLQALSNYLDQSKVNLYLGRTHNLQTKPLDSNGS